MPYENAFPLSFFESVTNPNTAETCNPTFAEFVELMSVFAEDEHPSKEAASLFTTTQFNHGKRRKANATQSGLVVLDIDHGPTIEDTWETVMDLDVSAMLYSTASHREDHHKFRLCIPLEINVLYQHYVKLWHALDYVFIDGMSDSSKAGCESLFYLPGQYPNAPSVFEVNNGAIFTPSEWLDIADLQEVQVGNSGKDKPTGNRTSVKSPDGSRTASSDDLDIYETKLVAETALNKYRSSYGDWHHARFGLMMSIVGRAKRMGISITQDDIINLFNQVDQIDGGHYQTSKYQHEIANDAANALAQAV
ncbi:MAG: hypothetical protein ABJE63_11905 [Lentilitoribacter sp.]